MKIRAFVYLTPWDLVMGALAIAAVLYVCLIQSWSIQ